MAENASNSVTYFLLIEASNKEYLGELRKWTNLKLAVDNDQIWVTNFDQFQIESIEVSSIPYKTIYYVKNGKIFTFNSLLPVRNEPSFLWTPIDRALNLKLGSYNENYFGVSESISISIIPSSQAELPEALIVSLITLGDYINSAPEVRLKNIYWVILNNKDALLIGKPLLPLNGISFWVNKNMIIPTGYNLELDLLVEVIDKKINPDQNCLIVWNNDSTYFKVKKDNLKKLSISSFRKSLVKIKEKFSYH